jgi:ABC-type transport system substrate-binding protein
VVPTFPRALGLVAGLADLLLLVGVAVAQIQQPRLRRQWREIRQPVVTLTSGLLTLVVILTTLFATKPLVLIASHQQSGYDFDYTYHKPTHTGGSVVIGTGLPIHTLIPPTLNGDLPDEAYHAVWNACVVQLPDLALPYFEGWKADQCREVPTVANDEEDPVNTKWTIFHIDPRAVWSDGQPLTADDFLFAFRLIKDPNVNGTVWPCGCPQIFPPWSLMHLTKLDARTVRIDWSVPYREYLTALARLTPLPLHVYARGQFAGVYDSATGAYNSSLARQMAAQGNFNLWIPVDNGPFIVRRVEGYGYPFPEYQANVISTAQRLVLAHNPRFFSNVFHMPTLDQVTFETVWSIKPELERTSVDKLVADYRQGGLTVTDTLGPLDLARLGGIPQSEVVASPIPEIITMGFNQRGVAPNARANGGVSIFADLTVRKAFDEAFDRCGALKAVLGLRDCNDRNFRTDEHATPVTLDFDPSATLPTYNSSDAAMLLTHAGYRVVDGARRFKDGTTPLQLLVSLSYGATPYADMAHRLQQDYARNLHIAVQIEKPLGQLLGDTSVTGAFDIGMWRESVGPDPVENLGGWAWNSAGIPSAQNPNGINFLGLIDTWVVAQDRLGMQTVDEAQRAEVYKGIVHHVTEQIDYLPLLINADITLVKPTLCNFKKWPDLGFYLWNMADWYKAPTCL